MGSVITGPIPNFPTFPVLPPELTSVPPGGAHPPNPSNYPYTGSGNSGAVEPECRYLTEGGVANADIGCRLDESQGASAPRDPRRCAGPIKLFVAGDFVLSGGNA